MKTGYLDAPSNDFYMPQSTPSRQFSSCRSVNVNGSIVGHVYKETTINDRGQIVTQRWYAHKSGERVHVLATSSTRAGATRLIGVGNLTA